MAHIDLPTEQPGILGLLAFRPQTAGPLNDLAETLLRGESPLSRADRELIAAYVSRRNDCDFCATSHGGVAALHYGQWREGWDRIDAVHRDLETAPISPKLRALLRVAGRVQESGRAVDDDVISAARQQGASDVEIHDTVLIAAAFCMFNRYVDGLGTAAPAHRDDYRPMAEQLSTRGYLTTAEQPAPR